MVTPVYERPEPTYDMHSNTHPATHTRSSDDDGTYVEEELSHQNSHTAPASGPGAPQRAGSHLTVNTEGLPPMNGVRSMQSPSRTREQESRLEDDLTMLQIERQISHQEELNRESSATRSVQRTRTRREDPIDEFDQATNPLHEKTALYKPPENPSTSLSRFFKKVHSSIWLVRYFVYITPLVLVILIPLLLGALLFKNAIVGDVKLVWFCIWLEIVWLTLWAGRVSMTGLSD
jgi:hypothetical protein